MEEPSKWDILKEVLKSVRQLARSLVHCAASDEPKPQPLITCFDPASRLLDSLRTIRQLGTFVSTHTEERTEVTDALRTTLTTLINFLDALLLAIFKGEGVSVHWLAAEASVQSSSILALSISLQCLSNTLTAYGTQNIEHPSVSLQSLLTVLLSGSRTRLLLTHTTVCSFESVTEEQRNRLISYSSYLLYLLFRLLRPIKLSDVAKDLVCSKLIQEPHVFSSLCSVAQLSDIDEESLLGSMRLHVQLLLQHLADTVGDECRSDEFHPRTNSVELEDVVLSTGLVLCLRQQAAQAETPDVQTNGGKVRPLPRTLPSCLLFWHAFVQNCDKATATMSAVFESLVQKLKLSYGLWFQALSAAKVVVHGSDDHIFPYAPLRGLVHVLAGLIFSNTRSSGRTDEAASDSSDSSDDESDEDSTFAFLQDDRLGDHVTPLWDCLCNLLVMLTIVTKHLEVHFAGLDSPADQDSTRMAEGSPCTVHPSGMSNALPKLHPTSPFSLCQAVGFKQDCIRCLTGLLHFHPRLAYRLSSHRLTEFPFKLPTNACTTAFEALLDATNKQPDNPFACEWAVLAIKLAVKPDTKDETALEGARLLATRLGDLKLIEG